MAINIEKLENKLDEEVYEWLTNIANMDRKEQASVFTALYVLMDNALEQREKLDEMSEVLDMFCGDEDNSDDEEDDDD